MRKKLFISLLLSLTAMAFAVSAFAQVTTASLGGKVTDANGEAVPGAAVVAVHQPSGSQYYGLTNAEGRYTITGMRSGGPYSVEVSCMGYRKVNYTDVTLQLAEVYALDAKLDDDKLMISEAVVISEASSKFAAEQTGAATNINNAQIVNLPTVSRSITDVTRLSPYGGNGMSFAGSDGRLANFTVDGANFNNNFGLSDNLPGGGKPISIDAIEELQVVISPYDVRQTNFIGGGVNAITKSGTNTFKGTAYVYHRNENMKGDTVAGEQITSGARAIDRNTIYGFTLGGPIIKNKLFFFVNAEYTQIPTVVNRWQGSTDGKMDAKNYISRTKLDDLEAVSEYVKSRYGYDTGSWTDFPADESNIKGLARIDWNISDKHHLSLRYNYTLNKYWQSPNGTSMDGGPRMSHYRMSEYSMSYANSMYSMQNLVSTWSLDLNSRLTDNLSNQFLATYSKLDDIRGTNSEEFPFIDITKGDDNYIALGYELFTWNNAVHNTVANVKDDITWFLGNHKITAGASFEYQMADNQYMRNGSGYYRYNWEDGMTVEQLFNSVPEVVCLTYGYDGEKYPAARVQFYKAGVYAQDEWSPVDRLKLTAGLRVDGLFFDNGDLLTNAAIQKLNYYPKAYDYAETHIDTGKWPNSSVTLSPRLGFNWDVLGNKSLKVRGGTGLFSGRLPLVFFTNMPTNGGLVQYQAQIGPSARYKNYPDAVKNSYKDVDAILATFAGGMKTDANGKPTVDALLNYLTGLGFPSTVSPEDGTVPSSISAVDPNFKMPQVWKSSLAFDYSLPTSFPLTVSAEGIFNKTINAVSISDWSMKDARGFARPNGADARPLYPNDFRTGTKAFVLENTDQGYGWSASASIKAEPTKALSLYAAYTHTVSKEITGMPGSAAESAFTYVPTSMGPNYIALHNSQYVTPDRAIASLTFHDKGGSHYSLIYEAWRGGSSYSYMLTNDMNNDGYNYDSVYIPTDEEVANNQFRFVSADDAERFMGFVHNDSYLSKNQGKYAEPYSVYNPWVHRLDLSYKHDFKVKIGNTSNVLQLSADIKNLLNLFNSSWGVSQRLNPEIGSEARILKYEGIDSEGYATFSTPASINANTQTFVPNYVLGQCWYASVGIKYMFN
ncbi:MAG: TonB-dependent receptor [Bacteroidales bacterium]|nr:TonB-dependent receptor [Bacteroidales bacterium]